MPKYQYFITATAERDLKRIGSAQSKRIGQKLQYFISTKNPLVFATQLTNIKPPIYRFRVGKYRIFFDIKDNTLRILSISLRDKAYRDF